MSDIRAALRSLLVGNAGVTAKAAQRVFPGRLPQGEKRDSIVLQRISAVAGYHYEGNDGLEFRRIQVDCWSQTAQGAYELAEAARDSLDGFSGAVMWGTDSPAPSVDIKGIFFDGEGEDFDPAAGLFRERRDFVARYRN